MNKRVKVERDYITVTHPGGHKYDFPYPTSASALAHWIRQLGEKTWVTKADLVDIADEVLSRCDR